MSSGRMPGFSAHVATTSFASVSIEFPCTSMYGAITRESPRAVMIEAFMSWTSLAMSEPETRSRVFAASSLMLQRRCRRISNVIGSTRIAGPAFAFVGSAIVIVFLPRARSPLDPEPLERPPVFDRRRIRSAQVQLVGKVERQELRALGLDDHSILLGDGGVAIGPDLVRLVEPEIGRASCRERGGDAGGAG